MDSLELGARGGAVKELQRQLNAWAMHEVVPVTGEFCSRTQALLKLFQRESGLPVTGVCTPTDLARLFALERSELRPLSKEEQEVVARHCKASHCV